MLDPAQDAEVSQVLEGASAAIVRYLAEFGDPAWDETTTPKDVQQYTLLLVDHYWWHRGGDLSAAEADDAHRQVWDADHVAAGDAARSGAGVDGDGALRAPRDGADAQPDARRRRRLCGHVDGSDAGLARQSRPGRRARCRVPDGGHDRGDGDACDRGPLSARCHRREPGLHFHDHARGVDRVFQVTNVRNLDERNRVLRLLTEEQV